MSLLYMIIEAAFWAGLMDTLIGNRIFPSIVQVVEKHDEHFNVRKRTRIFLIPIWFTLNNETKHRVFLAFGGRGHNFNKEEAIFYAKIYSNKKPQNKENKIIWSSSEKEEEFDFDKMKELSSRLKNANSIEEEKLILKELSEIHK